MITTASTSPLPELPPRPAPAELPEQRPLGFVLEELAGRYGLSAYAVLYTLADVRAWMRRPDPSLPLVKSRRDTVLQKAAGLGELRPVLRTLYSLLHDDPEEGTAEAIAQLCQGIACGRSGKRHP